MTQYILLIHGNTQSESTDQEWEYFFAQAKESGLFKGGSAIGDREMIGNKTVALTSHIEGFMRFDSDDKHRLIELINHHPVVLHGGSVELCEMPRS
jgi:hypothetical protein